MRAVVWTGLLLVLTMICSVTALAHMIGMPIGAWFLVCILMLVVLVGGLGLALLAKWEPQLVSTHLR